MKNLQPSRRTLFRAAAGAVAAPLWASNGVHAAPLPAPLPPRKNKQLPVSKRVQDYIEGANEAARQELNPTQSQLRRGLELHRESVVCDMHGQVNTNHRVGLYSERMRQWAVQKLAQGQDPAKTKDLIRSIRLETRRMRPIDIVHDQQLQGDYAALWDAAGVTVGVEPVGRADSEIAGLTDLVKQIARATYVYENLDWLQKLTKLDKLTALKSDRRHGVLFHCSKPDAYFAHPQIKDPLENLSLFYGLGMRISQLTNSNKNQVGCSHFQEPDTGLTAVGRAVIERMNELGMIVDLSHCGYKTTLAVIEASADPVIASHSACRGVHTGGKSQYRNITDEALKALARKGGLVGIPRVPNLLGDFGLEAFFKHIDYVVNLVGVDHAGFGADNGGMSMAAEPPEFIQALKPQNFQAEGLKGTERYWHYLNKPGSMSWTATPYITVGLVCRGYSDDDIRKIIGGNFLRVATPILEKSSQGILL